MNDNSSNNKRIAKNTLLMYFRMFFNMIVTLYTSRVILSSLGVEDYGIYGVVGSVVSMFSVFSASLSTSISRFITYELGKAKTEEIRRLFSTTVNIQICLAIIIAIIAEVVGLWFINNRMVIPSGRLFAASIAMQFSIATFCVNLVSIPYNAAIIAHEKMSAFAYISIYEVLAKLIISFFIFTTAHDKLIIYSLFLFILQISIRLIYGFYCKKNFEECIYKFVFDKHIFRNVSSFAGWSSMTLIAAIFNDTGINVLLNVFFGPVVNAAFSVMNQVKSAIQGFTRNFQVALNPQIIKSYAEGSKDRFIYLIFTGTRFSFFLAFIMILPVFFQIDNILRFWLSEVPEYTGLFIRLILCATLLYTIGDSLFTAEQATGNIKKYQIVTGPLMLAVLPLGYISCSLGGSPGMVIAIFILMLILVTCLCIKIVLCDVSVSLREYWNNVLLFIVKVIALSLPLPLLFHSLYRGQDFVEMLFGITICILSVAFSVLLVGITEKERKFIFSKILKITQGKENEK